MLGNLVTENSPQSEDKLCLLKASLAIVNELTTSVYFFSLLCVYMLRVFAWGDMCCAVHVEVRRQPRVRVLAFHLT